MDVDVEHTTLPNERTPLIPKSRPWKVLCATLSSAWGTLIFGYCLGYSSPASYDLQSEAVVSPAVHLNSSQQSWFSVSATVNEFKGYKTFALRLCRLKTEKISD